MEMQIVKSKNLAAVGYDEQAQLLYVRFQNGRQYKYFDVPGWQYKYLMAPPQMWSVGKYFSTQIKPYYKAVEV